MLRYLNILIVSILLVFVIGCSGGSDLPKHLRSLDPKSSSDYSNKAHNMIIKRFNVPKFDANIYLIACKNTKEAALIDYGGYGTKEIDHFINRNGLKLKAVFLTHGHRDHVWGASLVQNKYNVPVYIHDADKHFLQDMVGNFNRAGITHNAVPTNLVSINDGDQYDIGEFKVKVIHTPGHSPGSVCYYIPLKSVLFSGDTLFKKAVGRYDFQGGSKQDLKKSVMKLLALPKYTNVFAGHMDPTIIQDEISNNMVYSF